MNENIKKCVDARVDFFDKYYTVPENLKGQVDEFIEEINLLGETSADVAEFEARFSSTALQEKFNELLISCTPKAYKMTKEEKEFSKEFAKQNRGNVVKDVAKEVFDYASVMAEEELIAQSRKAMIEDEVFDDYTRASNAIDIVTRAGGFLSGLFGKGKKDK